MSTTSLSKPQASVTNPMSKIALTANLFEWYDFALTGYMALEIGKLFFPAATEHTSLILSFSVLAISYLVRPIGGLLLGLWGNKYGAGAALKLSLILMAIPSALIAFLPTYQTAGYWATGLLIMLKMVQGFAAGGEVPISAYYVSVNASDKNRGLYCSMVSSSSFLGLLLASFIVFSLPFLAKTISSWAPPTIMHSYAGEYWRWPFLLSIPLFLWIFKIRNTISEATCKSTQFIPRSKPVTPLIQASVLVAFMGAQIYTLFVWMPSYLHSYLGVSLVTARATNVITLIAYSFFLLLAGYSMRRFAAPKLAFLAACASLCSYPLFTLLPGGSFGTILSIQLFLAGGTACQAGAFALLPDLFKNNWQSLGMACAYSIPMSIFGGTAPLVCSFLIAQTHLLTAPALYLTFMGILAMPVAYRLAFPGRQEKGAADSGYEKSACV